MRGAEASGPGRDGGERTRAAFSPEPLTGEETCAAIARVVPPRRPALPVVFSSPHSGRCYPLDFLERAALPLADLRQTEDFLVDSLYARAPDFGFWLYAAQRPRCWLDLNRDARELDRSMFSDVPLDAGIVTTDRVRSGLGVIPKVVSEGRRIYEERLPWREACRRLDEGYFPWHAGLRALLEGLRERHGQAVLIDCHSMPASAVRAMTPLGGRAPDMILGDCEGESCATLLTDTLEALFSEAGLNVIRNRVYTGGFITRHYGLADLGFHAVQIEISRTLYMEEGRCRVSADFPALEQIIENVLAALPERLAPLWHPLREAAE